MLELIPTELKEDEIDVLAACEFDIDKEEYALLNTNPVELREKDENDSLAELVGGEYTLLDKTPVGLK